VNIKNLINLSIKKLSEDLEDDLNGKSFKNDITSNILLKKFKPLSCIISNREEIIICGVTFINEFFNRKYPNIKVKSFFKDGDKIKKNSKIFNLSGDAKIILGVERTILNFVQHLSSISTETHQFVSKIKNKKTQLLNTRKTTTGLRKLEKYATIVGGALNHRMGLYDDILIKDNHIKILGGIHKALESLNSKKIKKYKIECESFEDVKKSIDMGANYILLDNMNISEIKKCIILKKKRIIFEITGGITINNISKYSQLGADYISTGKITNSSNSVDIGLDII
jgi:nicotinate-nucleotide pyrophosphorylase (carboxylating)